MAHLDVRASPDAVQHQHRPRSSLVVLLLLPADSRRVRRRPGDAEGGEDQNGHDRDPGQHEENRAPLDRNARGVRILRLSRRGGSSSRQLVMKRDAYSST